MLDIVKTTGPFYLSPSCGALSFLRFVLIQLLTMGDEPRNWSSFFFLSNIYRSSLDANGCSVAPAQDLFIL